MKQAPKTITAWANSDGSTQFEGGTLFPKGVEVEYVRKDAADKVFKALNDLFIAVQDGCLTSEMEMATVMDNAQDALAEWETG